VLRKKRGSLIEKLDPVEERKMSSKMDAKVGEVPKK